jgi:hypothetical protein
MAAHNDPSRTDRQWPGWLVLSLPSVYFERRSSHVTWPKTSPENLPGIAQLPTRWTILYEDDIEALGLDASSRSNLRSS